ncbi:MAG: PKD domain-containing protein, partial [Dehalococcoidia bacterium]|nr:PKD domain-containing protein [Dehalococcoidia bacterium]
SLTPNFQWGSVANADYYALYISEPPYGPANLVFDSEEDYGPIYGTSLLLPSGILTEDVTYVWNMRAWNEAGPGPFSSGWSFTTNFNKPPICSVVPDTTSGQAPLTVNFALSASDPDGSIAAWVLDVDGDGDPNFSGIGDPPSSRTYTYYGGNPGGYSVVFIVADNAGEYAIDIKTVVVGDNTPPNCTLSPDKASGTVPLTVVFDISSNDADGSIVSWELLPGDRSPKYSGGGNPPPNLTHTYTVAGTYTAILMVKDNKEATAGASSTIYADETAPPSPVLLLLDPTSGIAGMSVNVIGTGFTPNSRLSSLSIDQINITPVQIITTSSIGGFATSFVVPDLESGTHTVTASAGGKTASNSFVITQEFEPSVRTPSITLTPPSGLPGSIVTIVGTGFDSYVTLSSLTVDALEVGPITTIVTGEAGSFSTTFAIPALLPGTHSVSATCGGKSAQANLTISQLGLGQIVVKKVQMYIGSKNVYQELAGESPVFLHGIPLDVRFEPEIDWGGHQIGTIKFVTPKGTFATSTLDVGNMLGVGGKLHVVARSSDGTESAPFEVPFEVAEFPLGSTIEELYSFDARTLTYSLLGGVGALACELVNQNIEGTRIPTTIVPFTEKPIKFKFLPNIKMQIDLKGYGSLMLGAEENGGNLIEYAGAKVPCLEKPTGRHAKLTNLASGEISFIGGASFHYDSTLGWQWSGSFEVGVEGSVQTPAAYVVIGFLPLYARFGTGVQFKASVEMGAVSVNPLHFEWQGDGTLEVYLKAMAGIGAADFASIEGWVKGGPTAPFRFPQVPAVERIYFDLQAGVTVRLCIFVKEYTTGRLQGTLYEDGTWSWPWESGLKGVLLDNAEAHLLSREYLETQPYAQFHQLAPESSLEGIDVNSENVGLGEQYTNSYYPQEQESVLQENVYPYSEPRIISQNGSVYAFWIYDDPSRGPVNRTELVYSEYSETGWSLPLPVYDDGTADFRPDAAFLPDGRILVAWENINETLSSNTTLEEMLSKSEITCAIYDPASDTWTSCQLTNNTALDRTPRLAIGNDGTALLTWIANEADDYVGSAENPNSVEYSLWNGNNWSTTLEVISETASMISTSLAYDGTTGYLVWETDADQDSSTLQDRELMMVAYDNGSGWGSSEQLTSDEQLDIAPQILFDNDMPVLIWAKNETLAVSRGTDFPNSATIVDTGYPCAGNGFEALSSSTGITLLWSDSSDEGSDIYRVVWDRANDKWGLPAQLTNDGSLERDIDAVGLSGDKVILIYDKVTINYTEDGIPQMGQTDLCLLEYEEHTDLAVNSIAIESTFPTVGDELIFDAEIANLGTTVEEDIPVLLYNGDPEEGGQLIATASLSGLLAPGATGQVSIAWQVDIAGPIMFVARIPDQFAENDIDRTNDTNSILGVINGETTVNNTPTGANVTIDLGNGVSVSFENVSEAGNTVTSVVDTITLAQANPVIPGYRVLDDSCYNITTTAGHSGNILVALHYEEFGLAGSENELKMLHFDGTSWVDATTLLDNANNYVHGQATDLSSFVVAEPLATAELVLKAGWNMVSLPVAPIHNVTSTVFPGVAGVFAWNATSRSYYVPTVIEPEKGYWVAVTENTTIAVNGTPVDTWTTDIKAGWNMVGSVNITATIADPNDDPDVSVIPTAYWWDPIGKSYNLTTAIEPGKGYWVASLSDCTLTL